MYDLEYQLIQELIRLSRDNILQIIEICGPFNLTVAAITIVALDMALTGIILHHAINRKRKH